MPNKYPKELEEQILTLYKEGLTTVEIAHRIGVKFNTSVRRVLIRNGIDLISTQERLSVVKTNPFIDLNNPATQYWLGYLAADGCLSKKKNCKDVTLIRLNTNKDPEHLLRYISFLGYPVKMYESFNKKYGVKEYCVGFSNKEACDYLIELGFTTAKSLTFYTKFNFDWNFVRGYFDGNGNASKGIISICSGSEKFINQLADFYRANGLTPFIRLSQTNCYLLNIYAIDQRKLWAKYVYNANLDEDLCLKRKKNIVLECSSLI